MRVKDLISHITNVLGHEELVHLGARPSPIDEPAFLIGDVRRLGDGVGWHPSYGIETGMLQTIEWWRQHLSGLRKGEST